MQKVYSRILWENYPSEQTPLNEQNLNKIDVAIDTIDDRIVNFDTTKANQSDLLQSLKNITYNESTGLFIFTWWNGTAKTVDLNVEKIPVSFSMSNAGVITMTNTDGTKYTADVSKLIKTYTFNTSSDIRFNTTTDTNGNKTITAFIVDGSVTEDKLDPNYLANIKVEVAKAEQFADNAETSANAAEQSEKAAKDAKDTSENYKDLTKTYSDSAAEAVEQVNKKLKLAEFDINENGELVYTDNSSYTFTVDDNGYLEWEVA